MKSKSTKPTPLIGKKTKATKSVGFAYNPNEVTNAVFEPTPADTIMGVLETFDPGVQNQIISDVLERVAVKRADLLETFEKGANKASREIRDFFSMAPNYEKVLAQIKENQISLKSNS